MKRFTSQEDKVLREMANDFSLKQIADNLNRNLGSVKGRIDRLGIARDPEKLAYRKKYGYKNVKEFRHTFPKGHVPWNKGLKGINFGGKKTQFKPGDKPHNTKPLYSERISKDGYVEKKVRETGRQFVLKHRWIWEQQHGPIPSGHIVIFKDGDKKNLSLDNLELISRKKNMQRNTIHNYPDELVEVMRLRGVLNRKINQSLNTK